MRNLYKRLGVTPTSDDAAIRAALVLCTEEGVRQDANRILLDPMARAVYDRNLQLLQQIAQAREALGLLNAPHWNQELRVNFPTMGSGAGAARTKKTKTAPKESYHWGWSLLLVVVLVGGIIFLRSSYWNYHRALNSNTEAAYSRFLEKHSDSQYAQEVKDRREEIRADLAFGKIERNFPNSSAKFDLKKREHYYLIGELDDVIKKFPATGSGQKAAELKNRARREMSRMITTPKEAIRFLEMFRDEAGAVIVAETLIEIIPNEESLVELDAIPSFLVELRNAGASREAVERSIPQAMRARRAEVQARFHNFPFVRNLNTKEAYERYLEQVPKGEYSDEARRRLVDLEVSEILKGEVGEMPELQPLGFTQNSSRASVEVVNDTAHNLTVRYSGKDSQKHSIGPKQKKTFQIGKGQYRVTATVDAGSVRPYAGTETISYDEYGVSFYIVTSRF